jgi:hypothetical protein
MPPETQKRATQTVATRSPSVTGLKVCEDKQRLELAKLKLVARNSKVDKQ